MNSQRSSWTDFNLVARRCAARVVRFAGVINSVMAIVSALAIGFPSSLAAQTVEFGTFVERHEPAGWDAAQRIWEWAEPGYQETRSSELLAGMLAARGFRVERGVAGIPTAFTATFGTGSPVIGILGEYDALPGLAQQAVTDRLAPAGGNGYGHACGHHLFGSASAVAALALADQLQATPRSGTIRFYGCPAEEGGSGKTFMVRAGLFADCDAVLHWHPSSRNSAGDASCLARVAVKFRFRGTSAHAAGAPEQGRSALDAVELTAHASELLREHTPDFTRIHHVVTAGGAAPNVVPDFSEMFFYIRHPQGEVVRDLYPRLVKCAQAGSLATDTKLEVEHLGGTVEMLPNETLAAIALKHLQAAKPLEYTPAEREFALKLQATLGKPEPLEQLSKVFDSSHELTKGSTDVGDVSWVVPTAGFTTACWVPGTPAHSWQAVSAGGTTIGRKGMRRAAEILSLTGWELLTSPETLAAAKAEHAKRLGERKYQPLLLPDQKPPLDYRKSPSP